MKIWPFDRFALRGRRAARSAMADLRTGLEPFRRIRRGGRRPDRDHARGTRLLGHHDRQEIAGAVEEYRPAWLEDMVLAHDVDAIAELKASTLDADHRQRDARSPATSTASCSSAAPPTSSWSTRRGPAGSPNRARSSTLAESFGLPVAMHDCTGPFTLLAGIHLALSRAERDLPGARPSLCPRLVQRARGRTGRDRRRPHPAADRTGHRDAPPARRSSSAPTRPSGSPLTAGG